VTLFGAVAAGVWLGGYRPALLVALVGYLACAYLFIPPRGGLAIEGARNIAGLIAYFTTCAIIIAFGELLRAARRQAEARRDEMRVTLRSIGDAVITTDRDGRITFMNRAAEALTGWTAGHAAGQALDVVFRIVNEETRERAENPVLRALREGAVVGPANHTILIGKDGTERPIDDSAAPIHGVAGRIVGCVLVFRDISDRRRREEDIRRAGDRMRSVVNTVVDGIITIDESGIVETFNPAAERLFGFGAAEVIGQNVKVLMPEPYHGEHDQYIATYLRTGQPRVIGLGREVVGRRKDGSTFPMDLAIGEFRIGSRRSFTGIVRDISERAKAFRRCADEGEPPEGRVPGDHGPRAPQSAGSDPERDPDPPAEGPPGPGAALVPGGDRPAGEAHDPPSR
jgi:PAS domain S-box-containing protein